MSADREDFSGCLVTRVRDPDEEPILHTSQVGDLHLCGLHLGVVDQLDRPHEVALGGLPVLRCEELGCEGVVRSA